MTNRSPTAVTRLPQWVRAGGSKGSDPAPDRRRGWRRAPESCPRHPPTRAARSPPHLDRAAPGNPALPSPRTRPRSVPAPRRTASPARARPGGAVRRWWSASWHGKIGAAPDSAKLTASGATLNARVVKLTSPGPLGPACGLPKATGEQEKFRPTMKGVMAMFVTTRSLQRDPVINRIFDVLGSLNGDSTQASWVPPVDIFEDAEAIRIIAELPGVKPEDVKISLENNVLTIRGSKQQVAEERTELVHRYDRTYATFERRFNLIATLTTRNIRPSNQYP